MRLSQKEVAAITKWADVHFGKGHQIQLFGSRTDDQKRGGDIDLIVTVSKSQIKQARQKKFYFIYDLQGDIGDQRIDVVITCKEDIEKDEFLQSLEPIEL